jgi:predicted membrane protein
MKPLNHLKIKTQKRNYYIMFFISFLFIFFCLLITFITANRGVAELEQKHRYYNNIVVKQGEMNLIIDEILVQLNDLRFKDRTLNERKNLQSLINEKRFKINAIIQESKTDLNNSFLLYEEFLLEIQQIQTRIDVLKESEGLFYINKSQLEKCIEKHNEEINNPTKVKNEKSN